MRDEESRMILSSLVSVIDDDESVRESLPDLLREFGFTARSFLAGGRVPCLRIRRSDRIVLISTSACRVCPGRNFNRN